jgi:hypothetical protein
MTHPTYFDVLARMLRAMGATADEADRWAMAKAGVYRYKDIYRYTLYRYNTGIISKVRYNAAFCGISPAV